MPAPKVERYSADLGCLAFLLDSDWVVVEPTGKVVGRYGGDEYEARTMAMCRNLTATDDEREAWKW